MVEEDGLSNFLNGKTEYSIELFRFFISKCNQIENIKVRPLKSMIGLEAQTTFAYITRLGKNFIHIVMPFNRPFEDNFCFTKIARVPGTTQYNHHLRIYNTADLNEEVFGFIKMAIVNIN